MLQFLLSCFTCQSGLGSFISQAQHFSVDLVSLQLRRLIYLKLQAAVSFLELFNLGLLSFIFLAEFLEINTCLAFFEHDLLLVELAHLTNRLRNEQAYFHLLFTAEFFGRVLRLAC